MNQHGKRMIKLAEHGHLETVKDVRKDSVVSPLYLLCRRATPLMLHLLDEKVNHSCTEMRPHMWKQEELSILILTEKTEREKDSLMISKIDLHYVFRKLQLSEEKSQNLNFEAI